MNTPEASLARPPTLIRLEVTREREPCCGENIAVVLDSKSPHAAALRCHSCGAPRGSLARRAVAFITQVQEAFGVVTELPTLKDRRVAVGDGEDQTTADTECTAMKREDFFASRFLSAADLKGKGVTAVIAGVTREELTGEDGVKKVKPVLTFTKAGKALVLNVTNWDTVAELYGEDTDGWIGQPIEVYPDRTKFGSKWVDCIRLRKPQSAARAQAPAPIPAHAPASMTHPQRTLEHPLQSDLEPPPHDGSEIPDSDVPW